MNIDKLRFLKLHHLAVLPTRSSQHAAGLDLYSIEEAEIKSGLWVGIRTGIAVEIPNAFYGRVAPRSGMALKSGIDVLAGVIDSDYRGEVLCVLINHGTGPVSIKVGDRIAQLIIEKIITPEPVWVSELNVTGRGGGGFGSSGT